MNTVVYTSLDKKVIHDWQSLWEKSPHANYTNSPQWLLSVIHTYGYKAYAIIAVYHNEKMIAAGGLVKEKKFGFSVYTVAPGDFINGTPFLIDTQDEALIRTFTGSLKKLGTVFLDNVSEAFLASLTKSGVLVDSVTQTLNYSLPIVLDEKGTAIISNRKILLHRIRKNADSFTFHSFDGTTSEGLKEAVAIDERSRKQNDGYSTFANADTVTFFKNLSRYFEKNIAYNILYFEKKPIAYEIGFIAGNTYFANQIAFTSEYKQYSPGKVIAVRLIDYLAARNIQKLDLGSGDSHIKRLLTDTHKEFYQVIISPDTITRSVLKKSTSLRNYLFNQLSKHPRAYAAFKNTKRLLIKK